MTEPDRPSRRPTGAWRSLRAEGWGRDRMAVRAGRVRIAIGLVGVLAVFSMPELAAYRPVLGAYFAIALVFQWTITRRVFAGIPRAFAMGIVDMLFLTYSVHLIGSASGVVPLIYVAAPVLYATTTSRRRLSISLAGFGSAAYALLVALELLHVIPYAPGNPRVGMPSPAMAIVSVLLVGICAFATAALTSQLIRALENANARLSDLSQHDELTGLYNRRYVMQRLADELARLGRKSSSLTVAMVDLDGFKRVNDEIGHDAGDAVLKAVAQALIVATRKADVVARYGGDEFVVLLPNTETEGARAVGARILDHARDAARQVCPSIPVSASIGTTLALPQDDPMELLRRVDEQLYAAKRAGGDRIYTD